MNRSIIHSYKTAINLLKKADPVLVKCLSPVARALRGEITRYLEHSTTKEHIENPLRSVQWVESAEKLILGIQKELDEGDDDDTSITYNQAAEVKRLARALKPAPYTPTDDEDDSDDEDEPQPKDQEEVRCCEEEQATATSPAIDWKDRAAHLRVALEGLLWEVAEFPETHFPNRAHPGFCTPETPCDATCKEIANMAMHNIAIRRARKVLLALDNKNA